MRILVIGGGGREHALCWALSRTATVFCTPGNPGTAQCATNVAADIRNEQSVRQVIKENRIDLTVIGPEDPLADGLADALRAGGHRTFGPTATAARIESSKAFAKDIMKNAGVRTAEGEAFDDLDQALAFIDAHAEPLVVKASGLAAGKGVVVCESQRAAREAATEMFRGRFGQAGSTVIVEEFLEGEEISVFVLTDATQVLMLPGSQDHKRLLEGDEGPNTGGMGAYCPVSIATDELAERVLRDIIHPTLRGMANADAPFSGVLYTGLMISPEGVPSVVEFNCRFGDPETQVLIPACNVDWADTCWNIANQTWKPQLASVTAERHAVTTVLASVGYPENPLKGAAISMPAELPEDTLLFHAGTKHTALGLTVSGGRVLAATGLGPTLADAVRRSRALAEVVQFEGKVFRRDIAWREEARHARAS